MILGTDAQQDPLVDKAADIAKSKVDKAKEMFDKASDKIQGKFDETLKKAEEFEAQEAKEKADNPTGIREDSTHADALKGSLLSGTDSFFDKAAKFAEGDYSGSQEGQITINEPGADANKNTGSVKGFEDLDGDGDEIIDDAIVEEEE
jgi:hypothetical protein